MEGGAKKEEVTIIETTTTTSKRTRSSADHGPTSTETKTIVHTADGKDTQWNIASITESLKTEEVNMKVEEAVNGYHKEEDQSAHGEISMQKKWEIESINTLDNEENDDHMTTQVLSLPNGEPAQDIKHESTLNQNGIFEIKSIHEVTVPMEAHQRVNTATIRHENINESYSKQKEPHLYDEQASKDPLKIPRPMPVASPITLSIRSDPGFTDNRPFERPPENARPLKLDNVDGIQTSLPHNANTFSRTSSAYMEESWTESHTIPIISSSVQIHTRDQPRQRPVYKITPVGTRNEGSTSFLLGNSLGKPPARTPTKEISTSRLRIDTKRAAGETAQPVDHYSYQYEDAAKTQKLRQLADLNRSRSFAYDSFERSFQEKGPVARRAQTVQWPADNCMRQSIHVDNDDEEILGEPIILDERKNPIKNLKDTQSFNSVTEHVSFEIHNMSAQMKIEIEVEMYHNAGGGRQLWKRKKVKVTRLVELDLSKIRDKGRLQDILDRCNAGQWEGYLKEKDELHLGTDSRLTGTNAYRVFYHLMAITHEEEGQSDTKENQYLTRSPSGKLTSVLCEPQILLTEVEDRENLSLFY